jgi:glycosyltransferase involved in cell wall biosynthesis
MNIAIFASAFHPHVGGVEELVRQLAHQYAARGHSAIVITNRWPRSLPAREIFEGIPLYRIPMRTPGPGIKALMTYLLTHGAIRRGLLSILRHHNTELLHIQCVSSNGLYALHAKRALGLPLVVTTQGERTMDAAGLYQRSKFMNRLLRQVIEQADFLTACSRNALDDILCYFGRSITPSPEVILNGVSLEDFARESRRPFDKPYVLAMGRVVKQKGFDILIESFERAGVVGMDLVIAGEGPELESLKRQADRLDLQERVRFAGRADRPQAVALFQHCEFFVLPSRMEPLGIVNLEAMAAGKAVIATRVGGVPEIVEDQHTGLLVPAEDVGAMAQAIKRLVVDADLRKELGDAGRARAGQFSWTRLAAQYERVYHRVLGSSLTHGASPTVTGSVLQPSA